MNSDQPRRQQYPPESQKQRPTLFILSVSPNAASPSLDVSKLIKAQTLEYTKEDELLRQSTFSTLQPSIHSRQHPNAFAWRQRFLPQRQPHPSFQNVLVKTSPRMRIPTSLSTSGLVESWASPQFQYVALNLGSATAISSPATDMKAGSRLGTKLHGGPATSRHLFTTLRPSLELPDASKPVKLNAIPATPNCPIL